MPTLKKIATTVIDRLGVPFNHTMYNDIKEQIIHYSNVYIKRRLDRGRIDEQYKIEYTIELEEVASMQPVESNALGSKVDEITIYKNKNAIPRTLDTFKSSRFTDAYIAHNSYSRTPLIQVEAGLLEDYFRSVGSGNTSIYTPTNEGIIVATSLTTNNVLVQDVFEYTLIVTNDFGIYNIGGLVFDENAEFPIDSNIIAITIDDIVSKYNGNGKDNISAEN